MEVFHYVANVVKSPIATASFQPMKNAMHIRIKITDTRRKNGKPEKENTVSVL